MTGRLSRNGWIVLFVLLLALVNGGILDPATITYRVLALAVSLALYGLVALWATSRVLGTPLHNTLDTVTAHALRSFVVGTGTYLVIGFAVTWGLFSLGLAGWVPETVGWPGEFFLSTGGLVVAWLTWPFHVLAFLACGTLPGGCHAG